MNLLVAHGIVDSNLPRAQTNVWTILFVQGLNIVYSTSPHHCELERQAAEFGVPRSRYSIQGVSQPSSQVLYAVSPEPSAVDLFQLALAKSNRAAMASATSALVDKINMLKWLRLLQQRDSRRLCGNLT